MLKVHAPVSIRADPRSPRTNSRTNEYTDFAD